MLIITVHDAHINSVCPYQYHHSLRVSLIYSFHLHLCLQSCHLSYGFLKKILHELHCVSMLQTVPKDEISVTILKEWYKYDAMTQAY
jgi:hypothetical protein